VFPYFFGTNADHTSLVLLGLSRVPVGCASLHMFGQTFWSLLPGVINIFVYLAGGRLPPLQLSGIMALRRKFSHLENTLTSSVMRTTSGLTSYITYLLHPASCDLCILLCDVPENLLSKLDLYALILWGGRVLGSLILIQ